MDTASDIRIRAAAPDDAPRLLEIYAYYVRETAVSFEYDVPSEAEFRERIAHTLTAYPYLAAECGGRILGYCYAGAAGERIAYARSAELSIYLDRDAHRRGIGRMLYTALLNELAAQGIVNVYAVIARPASEPDPYLGRDSEYFHAAMGFAPCAHLHRCGFKFGRWYDTVWMERSTGIHPEAFCGSADERSCLGAAIGLARAAGPGSLCPDELKDLLTRALTCTDASALPALTDELHAMKAEYAPNCAACADPCGRTADYDFAALDRAPQEVRLAKYMLLALLRRFAAEGDGAHFGFVTEALCAAGAERSAEELQRYEAVLRRALPLRDSAPAAPGF